MSKINHLPSLKEKREASKVTQAELAVAIGVSRLTYIKYENDQNTMPIGKYFAAENVLRSLNRVSDMELDQPTPDNKHPWHYKNGRWRCLDPKCRVKNTKSNIRGVK